MKKIQVMIFVIKMLATIGTTAIFNHFITTNFQANLLTLITLSFIFSISFFSLLSKEIEIIEEGKELFK